MAELIDRDALKAHYAWWGDTGERRTFDDIVDAQPAVDAVPVVRCGECIYRRTYSYLIHRCDCKDGIKKELLDDDFCSYGERKEQG